MTNVADFNRYKKAKVLEKDFEVIIMLLNISIKGLDQYLKYVPVMECVSVLKNNKTLLELNLRRIKTVINNKGNIIG